MRRPLVILLVALVTPVALVAQADSAPAPDPIAQLLARLDLERYKATIKGLTVFPTDLYATYDDADFRLGLNAAQTTLAALAGLVGATVK